MDAGQVSAGRITLRHPVNIRHRGGLRTFGERLADGVAAAYTGPVVMMSQNRQAARDRDEAEHDYEANRRALELLERLLEEQGRLRAELARRWGEREG